jgi:hypothetical protein
MFEDKSVDIEFMPESSDYIPGRLHAINASAAFFQPFPDDIGLAQGYPGIVAGDQLIRIDLQIL